MPSQYEMSCQTAFTWTGNRTGSFWSNFLIITQLLYFPEVFLFRSTPYGHMPLVLTFPPFPTFRFAEIQSIPASKYRTQHERWNSFPIQLQAEDTFQRKYTRIRSFSLVSLIAQSPMDEKRTSPSHPPHHSLLLFLLPV